MLDTVFGALRYHILRTLLHLPGLEMFPFKMKTEILMEPDDFKSQGFQENLTHLSNLSVIISNGQLHSGPPSPTSP